MFIFSILFYNHYLWVFFFFFLTFLTSLLLFNIKIIGGSDGKLIILIFLTHPIKYLSINIITSFYLFFSFIIILKFIFNYFLNRIIKDNCSFITFFSFISRFSRFQKLFIMSFYKFLDYSKLTISKEDKYIYRSLFLVYNYKKAKFQILVQIRSPLIVLIILAYLFVCLINLTV